MNIMFYLTIPLYYVSARYLLLIITDRTKLQLNRISLEQFYSIDGTAAETFGVEYDYNSIMHYRAYTFSIRMNDKVIMVPTDPNMSYTMIGRGERPTDKDYYKLNLLYDCSMNFLFLFAS